MGYPVDNKYIKKHIFIVKVIFTMTTWFFCQTLNTFDIFKAYMLLCTFLITSKLTSRAIGFPRSYMIIGKATNGAEALVSDHNLNSGFVSCPLQRHESISLEATICLGFSESRIQDELSQDIFLLAQLL